MGKELELARIIVNHSLNVKKDDKVLITYQNDMCNNLVKEIVNEVLNKGGIVNYRYVNQELNDFMRSRLDNKMIDNKVMEYKHDVYEYDCFVKIFYNESDYYDKFTNNNMKIKLNNKLEEYRDIQINKKRWVLLNYPSLLDSNKAGMTPREFYDFSMNAMTMDYDKMYKDMLVLKELMDKTDKVRITGNGTDISFSIKGMPSIICSGECNIPDGECYTAPVRNSVNGVISYNTPSPYDGEVFNNISLTFKDGKIIECNGSNKDHLERIFNTDEGARYIGEFSLGVNRNVKYPMCDILFDEKICGSLHFTPGCCYENCDNGNKSTIHWDLVLIQRADYGGGCIYFDDKLIRKDGLFVLDELKNLNF